MKKHYFYMLLPCVLALASCNMFSIEVNQAPTSGEYVEPNPPSSNTTTETVNPPAPNPDHPDSGDSGNSDQPVDPNPGTGSGEDSHDPYTGLSFADAKVILDKMVTYLDSGEFIEPTQIKHISDVTAMSISKNPVLTNTYTDSRINIDKLQYFSSKKVKEVISLEKAQESKEYVYKQVDKDIIIHAHEKQEGNTYTEIISTPETIRQDFINEVKVFKQDHVKNLTKSAIDMVRNNENILKFADEIKITSNNDGHIDLKGSKTVKLNLPLVGETTTTTTIELKIIDYKVIYQCLDVNTNGIPNIIKDTYKYEPYEYKSYPNLDLYSKVEQAQ